MNANLLGASLIADASMATADNVMNTIAIAFGSMTLHTNLAILSVDCCVIADSTNLEIGLWCLASHDLNTTPGSSYESTPHSAEIVQLLNETDPFDETFFVADHSLRTAKPDTRYELSLRSSTRRDRNPVTGIVESVDKPATRERARRDFLRVPHHKLESSKRIKKGMDATDGTNAAHYETGVPYIDNAKPHIGLRPAGDKRYVSQTHIRDFFADVEAKNTATYNEWQVSVAARCADKPAFAQQLKTIILVQVPSAAEMNVYVPASGINTPESTRISRKDALTELAKTVSHYISGSAALHGSCRYYINCGGNFGAGFNKTYAGCNVYFGIREHGSVINGFAYHDLFKAFGSTFLVFVDCLRPILIGCFHDLWSSCFFFPFSALQYPICIVSPLLLSQISILQSMGGGERIQ